MNQKTIYIETYGCTANQNNSEILAGLLTQAGYIVTNNQDLADIIIINTCVVKHKTENKIKRRIQDLKSWSQNRSHLLIIAGCMPETDSKAIKNLNPYSHILSTHNYIGIIKLLRELSTGKPRDENSKSIPNSEVKLNLPKIPKNKLISIHQISEGCLGNCSYCKTRLAKGKLHSYSQDEILKSIESDLSKGAKEIWITSQDNANYGLDRSEHKRQLPELLKKILSLKHRFKLRLGMMDPNNVLPILDQLIRIYKDKKIYKFIHIPIQSASDKVLKDMNRLYQIEDVERIIISFKKQFPNMTIATDIIVGYPTETASDHKANLDFINKYKSAVLNLSKFSRHKGTPAEKLKELPAKTIRKRTKVLMQAHRLTAREDKKQYIGKIIKVFVYERIENEFHKARDENYNLVLVKCSKDKLGKEIKVKIRDIGVHNLIGDFIK